MMNAILALIVLVAGDLPKPQADPFMSISAMCRTADYIGIGEIACHQGQGFRWITFKSERDLLGQHSWWKAGVFAVPRDAWIGIGVGDAPRRGIIFASDRVSMSAGGISNIDPLHVLRWDFDSANEPWFELGYMSLLNPGGGAIMFKNEDERDLCVYVEEALRTIRGQQKDKWAYFTALKKGIESSQSRVHEIAANDFGLLVTFGMDIEELKKGNRRSGVGRNVPGNGTEAT